MKLEKMQEYKSNILLLQRLAFGLYLIQMVSATYFLFIPSTLEDTIFSPVGGIATGVLINLLGVILTSRFVDLESLGLLKFFRITVFLGLIYQYMIGLNTLYSITLFVIAGIGEQLIFPTLELIKRTQNYASHEKLTEELFNAISHANSFLDKQIRWITKSILLIIIVAVIAIISITIFNILPLILPNVRIIQYISIAALLILLIIITKFGFPNFEHIEKEYEIYN